MMLSMQWFFAFAFVFFTHRLSVKIVTSDTFRFHLNLLVLLGLL